MKFELEYIPKASVSIHNKLRYYYDIFRRKGIVKSVSREECLRDAIDRLKEDYPSFDPKFDEDFFKMHEKGFFRRLLDRMRRGKKRSRG